MKCNGLVMSATRWLTLLIAAIGLTSAAFGQTQNQSSDTPSVRFLNDWRWEGPAAPLLMAVKTNFPADKLKVTATPGTGSGATIAAVAKGDFDMGIGDFGALIEYAAKNPTETPPVAVYVVYDRMPAALFVRKSTGGTKLADITGKKLGAPAFDAGRRLWPAFASLANLGAVTWENVDAAQREAAFAEGKVDAITGFYFTTMLNLEKKGVSGYDYAVYPFHEQGLRMYGNVIMVNPKFLAANPKTVTRVLKAYDGALRDALRDPERAIGAVKEAEPKTDEKLEYRRLRIAFEQFVQTQRANEIGLGVMEASRVQSSIDTIVDAFKLPAKPAAAAVARLDMLRGGR